MLAGRRQQHDLQNCIAVGAKGAFLSSQPPVGPQGPLGGFVQGSSQLENSKKKKLCPLPVLFSLSGSGLQCLQSAGRCAEGLLRIPRRAPQNPQNLAGGKGCKGKLVSKAMKSCELQCYLAHSPELKAFKPGCCNTPD